MGDVLVLVRKAAERKQTMLIATEEMQVARDRRPSGVHTQRKDLREWGARSDFQHPAG
ncbi:hypothetical protein [Roseovarius tibetensis]|uniref:hypothetical protein n=1 Tax=Roseovarius tibetensis TaxID=2685897 RepID=UPI003D7F83C8